MDYLTFDCWTFDYLTFDCFILVIGLMPKAIKVSPPRLCREMTGYVFVRGGAMLPILLPAFLPKNATFGQ